MKHDPDKIKDDLIVNSITRVLVDRDGMTPNDASDEYKAALRSFRSEIMEEGSSYPGNFCRTWFGLEEDYLDILLEDSL